MKTAGITLIELMVVVMIIAILAGIAYPSYTNYVTKSTRSAAQSMLTQTANRQVQFFSDNKRYAANMTELGHGAEILKVTRDGSPTTGDDAVYQIEITVGGGTAYTIVATPLGIQATRDTDCTQLSLDHRGQKAATGAKPDNCW